MSQFDKNQIKQLQKQYIKEVKQYGGENIRSIKKLLATALLIEAREEHYETYSDSQLADMTVEFKQQLANGKTLDDILVDAFAVVREAAKRVLHQRHYLVQLMGGIALHQGRIAQMSTGEGKTLTETLPAYLNALSGNGVHIVTVNEYLAVRDTQWMGKVFKFLGLTVGTITTGQNRQAKQFAYNCDITYGTNNEFGFDYLRDNMAPSMSAKMQRMLNYVIIDEVDSILIDEARTPLIISGPSGKSSQMYKTANSFVVTLKPSTNVDSKGDLIDEQEDYNGDYIVNEKYKTVRLSDSGIAKAERFFKVDNLSDPDNTDLNHYIVNALRAHATMRRDNDYIVDRGEIIIVDEHTGRKMIGRRYSNGLHQAIEAKENVTIKQENRTLATITFQNYFKLYKKMSGMTGTAKTEEEEFNSIYNIDVVVVPTNLPNIRIDLPDAIFTKRQGKLYNIADRVAEISSTGQPILIGVVSVEASEELAALLSKKGIKYNLLNAKNHQREAEIIAQAGRLNSITIATNMAGRGTDILLGGNAEFMAKQEMNRLGYSNEEVELATSFVVGDEIQQKLADVYRELYTKYKVICDQEHNKVVEVGGLYVIGSERHDSRRIDNQLRGRAGRQGDPGTTQFFMATDDNMMRIFGNMLSNAMGLFNLADDAPIESKMISKQIEKAQKNVESRHFAARKNVLQYDNVNNRQRNLIYGQRDKILAGEDIHQEILDMCTVFARKVLEEAVNGVENIANWDMRMVNDMLAKAIPMGQHPMLVQGEFSTARQALEILTDKVVQLIETKANKPIESEEDVPFAEVEKYFLLSNIDKLWMDHLENLDSLKQGVGLQAIGNHNPVDVYKKEAFNLFDNLNDEIAFQTIRHLLFGTIKRRLVSTPQPTEEDGKVSLKSMCPCGSGKRYKDCCYLKKHADANKADTTDKPLTKQEEYALKRAERKKSKDNK